MEQAGVQKLMKTPKKRFYLGGLGNMRMPDCHCLNVRAKFGGNNVSEKSD